MNPTDAPPATPPALRLLPVEPVPSKLTQRLLRARFLLRILVPVLVIAFWQWSSNRVEVGGFQLPSPSEVVAGLKELWQGGDIQSAIPASLARAGTGLLIGLAIGLVLGIANGLSRLSEELFDSTMQIVRVIPFIAVVPLFLVWFGIGEQMKIILISLACAFPVYINTYSAMKHVDHRLVEVGQTFGMGRMRVIATIIVPAALPSILVGVRYAMSTSLLALIVAEQVNTQSGIGHIINVASNALRVDLIMAGIVIYAVLGVLVDAVMRLIERYSMPWIDRKGSR